MLPQEQLALPLPQLLLDLGLDLLLGVEHADLPLDVNQHTAQPVLDRERFQQRLALGRLDLEVTGHEVGEPPRLGHPLEHLPDNLFGQPGLLAQLRSALARFTVQGDEGRILRTKRRQILHLPHDRLEVPLDLEVMERGTSLLAVQ